jgi:nucleotide-binding universal stress UspA family protein
MRRDDQLFSEILVAISGEPNGWFALEQALIIAQREHAWLHGLHVVPSEEQRLSEAALAIQAEFNRRCQEAGVRGQLVISVGDVSGQIISRSRWTDLIVTSLNYPPGQQPLARLSSGFRELIQSCSRPLLAAPQTSTGLNRALLAYDGSPKAEEALFISTYVAGRWKIPLVVVSVPDNGRVSIQTLEHAREYLEAHGVSASYMLESGPTAETILKASDEHQCDWLIMGGYGYNPLIEVVLGSVVDQVLRESQKPILICR